jgi:hypothetical protein
MGGAHVNPMQSSDSTSPDHGTSPQPADDAIATAEEGQSAFRSEDLWAIWLGWAVLLVALGATWWSRPESHAERLARYEELTAQTDALHGVESSRDQLQAIEAERDEVRKQLANNPLAPWLAKLGSWSDDPLAAFRSKSGASDLCSSGSVWRGWASVWARSPWRF